MTPTISAAWRRRIDEAQDITHDSVAGVERARVAYGDEPSLRRFAQSPRCRDCAAELGQLHVPGCCVEACPACGEQAISCSCLDGPAH